MEKVGIFHLFSKKVSSKLGTYKIFFLSLHYQMRVSRYLKMITYTKTL